MGRQQRLANTVARLRNDGTLVTTVPVGNTPTGVAVDAAGKVWVTNYGSSNAMRIDPATNSVDLTVSLGSGATPYTYSDMTGSVILGSPPRGKWIVVHDSGAAGTAWGTVSWRQQRCQAPAWPSAYAAQIARSAWAASRG